MRKRVQIIGIIALGVIASGSMEAATFEISPDGPVSTLDEARLKVRELKKLQPGQPIEVLIKGGTYPLRETVVFGLDDSGTAGAPVVYKAYPGEQPVFTGGIPISGWRKVADYPEGVSDAAKGNLWVANVPKVGKKQWIIRSLYDGETLLKRARSGGFKYAGIEKESDSNRQGKKLTSVLEYEGGASASV